jgi:predicted nucleotidyltransferase
MRLTEYQQEQIHNSLFEVFGNKIEIILFGSRVNDAAKGGDIDLLVEADSDDNELYLKKLKALTLLKKRLGDRKIDLIVHSVKSPELPLIVKEAHQTGIRI